MGPDSTETGPTAVHIAGDWHRNWPWASTALKRLAADGCTTLIHAGDFGYWPDREGLCDYMVAVDHLAGQLGIQVVVVPGNHEDWGVLAPKLRNADGTPKDELFRLGDNLAVAPVGYRLEIGSRIFGLVGGAVSIDRVSRIEGHTWWPDERITYREADAISRQDPVDVLITHDAPAHGTVAVMRQRAKPSSIPDDDKLLANQHNGLVQSISDSLHPALHFHGHWHVPDSARVAGGPEVVSLGMDGDRMNLVRLDLDTLKWRAVPVGPADPPAGLAG